MSGKRLFLLNIVDEKNIQKIGKLRKNLCDFSQSYASLQFPSHITIAHLKIPEEEDWKDCLSKIEKSLEGVHSFKVKTDGIVAESYSEREKTKYTLRFNIKDNKGIRDIGQRIINVQGKNIDWDNSKGLPMTLVFGDVTKENYEKLTHLIKQKKYRGINFEYNFNNVSVFSRESFEWAKIKKIDII